MSIVVFDPDSTEDVDFKDRMRHPAAADPAGGMWLSDTEPSFIDADALRKGRLAKLRGWMRDAGYGGVVLFDPYNQRYATGSRNMFGYFLRNSTRYFFIPTEGPIVLFESPQSYHVSMVLDTIDEARPSKLVWSSVSGRDDETAGPFAGEIAELLKKHGGGSMKLGLDRCSHLQALALEKRGCEVKDCQGEILAVRAVKTPEEVKCLQVSMAGAEAAVYAVREAIKPGVSENDLFAIMYGEVIRQGGEFIETRLLTSGQRTNPWFNEASGRKIRPGELLALDTDTIGCYGYYSDFSRTFRCGPGKPTDYQKSLYRMAHDQVQHNISIVKPGMAFREIAEKAWKIPDRFVDQRYTSVMHGVGMHGETPFIAHAMDYETYGRDGHIVPGMVVSVESYIGEKGGREGVKLEDEILITETGTELLSRFPYEDEFFGVKAPISIKRGTVAAVFIDLQEEHRQDKRYLVEGFAGILANVQRLQEAARANHVPLQHWAYIVDLDKQDRPFHPLGADGKSAFSDKSDPLTEICREVAPARDEVLLIKAEASALRSGPAADRLKASGIEWLVVAGVWTEACIDATVKDAVAKGFRVLLVKDACGSGSAAMHQTGILNLANRLYGGAVTDTDGACRLLAGETVTAWQVEGSVPLRFTFDNAAALYADL